MDFPTFERFVHEREEQLHALFRDLDADDSGVIDLAEMTEAIKKYNPTVSEVDFRNQGEPDGLPMLKAFSRLNPSRGSETPV